MPGIAAIILAAGGSSRMGRAKQLLPVGGVPMLSRVIASARGVGCRPIVVVLGRDADACQAVVVGEDTSVVVHPDWQSGMGTSLRAGATAVPADVDAAFVLLADQPQVSADTLRELARASTDAGKPVAVASFAGTVGPPVFVSGRYLMRLRDWPDRGGAKSLWLERADEVVHVPYAEAACDIDTPDDYRRLLSRQDSKEGL